MKLIVSTKDFWSGIFFILFGAAAIYFARQHPVGTTVRMGPGAFPVLLGWTLIAIGGITIGRTVVRPGLPIETITIYRPSLILLSIVAFALLLAPLGLVGATIVLVLISSFASRKFYAPSALALGIGLGVGSAAVFAWALGLPIPVVGTWLGG